MANRPVWLAIAAAGAMLLVAGCTAAGQPADNPWGRQNVTVGVTDATEVLMGEEDVDALRNALEYWNTDGSQYATYNARFVLDPDAEDTDIVVIFHKDLSICKRFAVGDEYAGCAPIMNKDSETPKPVIVDIALSTPDSNMEDVIKHEFGHIVGLNHSDRPQEIMKPRF